MKPTRLIFALLLALAAPWANAGMIATDEQERVRMQSLLERPEVAAELQKMGIPPDEARARVDAMTPQEVSQLAGRLDALPAGGAVSNRDLILVVVLLLLLLLIL